MHVVASDRAIAWQQQVNNAGRSMTGHHPNAGWFCTTSTDTAIKMAARHTSKEALRSTHKEVSEK